MGRIIRPEVQQRWLLPQLASITPTYLENILRGAMGGAHIQQWELFELMEDTWPRLLKDLNQLKRAVQMLDWKLEPWAEEGEAVSATALERHKLVSRGLYGMSPTLGWDEDALGGTIMNLLDAWAKGTSVIEIQWELREGAWLPKSTYWVHPRNYGWTQEGWLGLVGGYGGTLSPTNMPSYPVPSGVSNGAVPFPENKFIVAFCKAKTGHPLSGALLRPLAWWWCAANFSADWLLNLAQIFGLPIRWAQYDPQASQSTISAICTMLESMGSAAWAAFPAGTQLELHEAAKGADSYPQAAVLDRADKNCDLLILGQTLTSEPGDRGSQALGTVHKEVEEELVRAAAGWVADCLNEQLIKPMLRLNYGDDSEPPELAGESAGPEASALLEFKRAVFKGFMADGTVSDVLANQTDFKVLTKDVGLPVNEEYIDPYLPVMDAAGNLVTGELVRDSVGDVIGAEVARAGAEPGEETGKTLESGKQKAEMPDAAAEAVQAAEATEQLINNVMEGLTGVKAQWLGGVKPFFRELVSAAKNTTLSDADFVAVVEKSRKQLPELFKRLDSGAVAKSLEAAMGAAAFNGAMRGFMERRTGRQNHGGTESSLAGKGGGA